MKVIVVFKRLLASGNYNNMAAIYSNGGDRWNILSFNFTKRDALSSVYKISIYARTNEKITAKITPTTFVFADNKMFPDTSESGCQASVDGV